MLKVFSYLLINQSGQLMYSLNRPSIETRHCVRGCSCFQPCAEFKMFSLLLLSFRTSKIFLLASLCRHRGRTILSSLAGVSSLVSAPSSYEAWLRIVSIWRDPLNLRNLLISITANWYKYLYTTF